MISVPFRGRWQAFRNRRASQRELAYLESRIFVTSTDLEQRSRKPVRLEEEIAPTIRIWRELSRRGFDLCLDVGANYGAFTLAGRYDAGARCMAFEPNALVRDCLARSVDTHPDRERIEIVPLVVSDADGDVEFHIDTLKSGCSSIHESPRFRGALSTVRVRATTLDAMARERGWRPKRLLIKTDTEGNDFRVLQGAGSLLAGAGEVAGLCEFAPDMLAAAGSDPAVFMKFLTDRYETWVVTDKPAPALTRVGDAASAAAATANLAYCSRAGLIEALAHAAGIPIIHS